MLVSERSCREHFISRDCRVKKNIPFLKGNTALLESPQVLENQSAATFAEMGLLERVAPSWVLEKPCQAL